MHLSATPTQRVGLATVLVFAAIVAGDRMASFAEGSPAGAADAAAVEPGRPRIGLVTPVERPLRVPAEGVASREAGGPPAAPVISARTVDAAPAAAEMAVAPPLLKAGDPTWVATRVAVPALGIDLPLYRARNAAEENFPPYYGAYILRSSSEPGRGSNTFIYSHAMPDLFKPLWWAAPGMQVVITMADGQRLEYRITSVNRDIPCPDPSVPKPPGLPPVLANATYCDTSWMLPTPTERLTLQTSQGFNRNYGELIIVAEPAW